MAKNLTDAEQRTVEDLLRERRGYVARDLPARVAAVDHELAKLGVKPEREDKVETATADTPERAVTRRGRT